MKNLLSDVRTLVAPKEEQQHLLALRQWHWQIIPCSLPALVFQYKALGCSYEVCECWGFESAKTTERDMRSTR